MPRDAIMVLAGCALALAGLACGNSSEPNEPGTGAPAGAGSTAPMTATPGAAGAGATAGAGSNPVGAAGASMPTGTAGAGNTLAGSGAAMNMPGAMAGNGAPAAAGAMAMIPIDPSKLDYDGETVMLTETLIIPAGKTVQVGPGTTFMASAGVKVQVEGTLLVAGSAEAHAKFQGAGMPRSWEGIVIKSGGVLQLDYVDIGGATYGIHAEAGSMYTVDHAEIGTSFKAAVLYAGGSFDHTKFHASGDDTFSPVNEVSMDDVNGTLTIIDASPTVSNSSFDNSSSLVDMIRIGGKSSPVFDHVSVVGAHCGFHTNGGVNTEPTIKNSVLKGMSYGIMAYTSKAKIENCNFIDNSADVGFCFDAVADNAPTLTNNFYSSGNVSYDATCYEIGKPDPTPASAARNDVGPAGL